MNLNAQKLAVASLLVALNIFARAEDQGAPIVAKVSDHMAAFLDVFSDVKCTEHVLQTKLKKSGKVEYEEQSTFDYLVIAQNSGEELALNESRLEEGTVEHRKNTSLLVTNGFATLLLIFHPQYAAAFEFSPAGPEALNGRIAEKVHFRHLKGRATPMALMLRGRVYPLELTGDAWVDPETGAVLRIRAELQDDMDDIGLHSLVSDVVYAETKFRGTDPAWLPATATIDVETPRQHWRNVHRFTKYQRFSVSTEETVKTTP